MTQFFLYSTVILAIIISIPLIRVAQGPTIYDRLMGTNAIAAKTIVLITLLGYIYGRIDMFIDITLAYAILGFIGILTIAKFVTTKRIDDQ